MLIEPQPIPNLLCTSQANPLLPAAEAAPGGGDADMAADAAGEAPETAPVSYEAVSRAVDDEMLDVSSPEALSAVMGKLDQVLTYLWAVHGIDYYAGERG